jgi:RNA polymerase sigma-70 factor (ECF subfamily)
MSPLKRALYTSTQCLARASYQRALELTRQPAERRFLQARLTQLAAELTTVRN